MFGKGWLQSTIIVSIVYGKKCNNEIISVVCHYVDVVIMYNSHMSALNVQFDPVAAFKMLSLSFHKEWVYTLFAETAPLMEVQRYKHFMWRCDKSMQRNQLWCLNRTVTGRLCDHSRTPLNSRHPWYTQTILNILTVFPFEFTSILKQPLNSGHPATPFNRQSTRSQFYRNNT